MNIVKCRSDCLGCLCESAEQFERLFLLELEEVSLVKDNCLDNLFSRFYGVLAPSNARWLPFFSDDGKCNLLSVY